MNLDKTREQYQNISCTTGWAVLSSEHYEEWFQLHFNFSINRSQPGFAQPVLVEHLKCRDDGFLV